MLGPTLHRKNRVGDPCGALRGGDLLVSGGHPHLFGKSDAVGDVGESVAVGDDDRPVGGHTGDPVEAEVHDADVERGADVPRLLQRIAAVGRAAESAGCGGRRNRVALSPRGRHRNGCCGGSAAGAGRRHRSDAGAEPCGTGAGGAGCGRRARGCRRSGRGQRYRRGRGGSSRRGCPHRGGTGAAGHPAACTAHARPARRRWRCCRGLAAGLRCRSRGRGRRRRSERWRRLSGQRLHRCGTGGFGRVSGGSRTCGLAGGGSGRGRGACSRRRRAGSGGRA